MYSFSLTFSNSFQASVVLSAGGKLVESLVSDVEVVRLDPESLLEHLPVLVQTEVRTGPGVGNEVAVDTSSINWSETRDIQCIWNCRHPGGCNGEGNNYELNK